MMTKDAPRYFDILNKIYRCAGQEVGKFFAPLGGIYREDLNEDMFEDQAKDYAMQTIMNCFSYEVSFLLK